MTVYSIKQVANLAGVTVRTLQYYDKTGLLCPAARTSNHHRVYHRDDLLKLQHILFYKELDISLKDINVVVNHATFNRLQALEQSKYAMKHHVKRIKSLLQTIDKSIEEVKSRGELMTDKELFVGFTPPEI